MKGPRILNQQIADEIRSRFARRPSNWTAQQEGKYWGVSACAIWKIIACTTYKGKKERREAA